MARAISAALAGSVAKLIRESERYCDVDRLAGLEPVDQSDEFGSGVAHGYAPGQAPTLFRRWHFSDLPGPSRAAARSHAAGRRMRLPASARRY